MMKLKYGRVVVKVGSGIITKANRLNRAVLCGIVEQIVTLHERGIEVVLVTSGAVATGRGIVKIPEKSGDIGSKQVLAAVGQVQLMTFYTNLFKGHSCVCAQVLATKEDFRDKHHYLNMKNCLEKLLVLGIIPIVNENDVVAISELMFTDNDELAGLLAAQLNADAVILLTSVDGVLSGDPGDSTSQVIPEINLSNSASFGKYITNDISSSGRGGMHTKFGIARKLAIQGIVTHIANGKNPTILPSILEGVSIGTRFVPAKRISGAKRRLAYSDGFSKGAIVVDEQARGILLRVEAASVLPVGITKVEGNFAKDDVIEVRGPDGDRIGFGIARYDSQRAFRLIGKRNVGALIHCDYLFIG